MEKIYFSEENEGLTNKNKYYDISYMYIRRKIIKINLYLQNIYILRTLTTILYTSPWINLAIVEYYM